MHLEELQLALLISAEQLLELLYGATSLFMLQEMFHCPSPAIAGQDSFIQELDQPHGLQCGMAV